MGKRVGVILNPVAGKKRGKTMLADFLEGLSRLSMEISVFVTSKRLDAANAAYRFGKDCDIVCCIGGDGTLNEVISGLMQLESPPALCYLPTGSTNDFAITCGVPTEISKLLSLVRKGKTVKVDVGSFEGRYFTYIASFGLFTRASYSADQTVKNLIGHMAYVVEGAKELQDLGKTYHVKASSECGEVEGDYIFGGVASTTSLGGIFTLPRHCVTLDDGLFEFLLIRAPKTVDDLIKTLNMMQRGDFDGERIVFWQVRSLTLRSDQPISYCLDGEFAGDRTTVTITNHQRALTLYSSSGDMFLPEENKPAVEGEEGA